MPLLNKKLQKNVSKEIKGAYLKKCSIRGMRLKSIGCMVKFFWFRSAEANVVNGFLSFGSKKIAARLPFRKNFKFGLNQRFLT